MNFPDRYFIPTQNAHALFKEKGSKFIGYLFCARSREQAEGHLQDLKKKHFDATHHCSAMRILQPGGAIESRYDDDGEPSQTAGLPISQALNSENVLQAMIVVVRYFGGTKLGTGGLVRAYRQAAKLVLDEKNLSEQRYRFRVEGVCPYGHYKQFLRLIQQVDGKKETEQFTEQITFSYTLPHAEQDRVTSLFEELFRSGLSWEKTGNVV